MKEMSVITGQISDDLLVIVPPDEEDYEWP